MVSKSQVQQKILTQSTIINQKVGFENPFDEDQFTFENNLYSTQKTRYRQQTYSNNIDKLDFDLINLIQESAAYPDDLKVVWQEEESQNIYFDTVNEALKQFNQGNRVTDEELLNDYVYMLRNDVVANIRKELKKIDNLIEQKFEDSFLQNQGKQLYKYLVKVFTSQQQKTKIQKDFTILVKSFLEAQKKLLLQICKILEIDDQSSDKQQYDDGSLLVSQPNFSQQLDENNNLKIEDQNTIQQLRKNLESLQLYVWKTVIIVERINYYTMGGVVLPRDYQINIVPFFGEVVQNTQYDCQSCLKICTLIKHQIERLEQIEKQTLQTKLPELRKSNYQQQTSYLFTRNPQERINKKEYKLKTDLLQFKQRQMQIFEEFTSQTTKGRLEDIQVNLHLKVKQYGDGYKVHTNYSSSNLINEERKTNLSNQKYKLQFQLFKAPGKPQCQQCTINNIQDSWLFTEIKFSETLIKEDLILLIKVFNQRDSQSTILQQIFPESYYETEGQKFSFIKAFSIINLSETFFDSRMREGIPIELPQVNFYAFEQVFGNIDSEYDQINQKILDEGNKYLDLELTRKLQLKLKIAFLTSIHRNQLALKLHESVIIRQENYWLQMIPRELNLLKDDDPLTLYQHEIEKLNIKNLKSMPNEMRVRIDKLKLTKDQSNYNNCMLQVYLFQESQREGQRLGRRKSLKSFLTHKNTGMFYHQTHIMTLKKGNGNFNSEFRIKLPSITQKISELGQYRLLFVILVPEDKKNTKIQTHKIEQNQILQNVTNYYFNPVLFGELNLIEKSEDAIIGNEIHIDLLKTSLAKIEEQDKIVSSDTKYQVYGSINVSIELISSQFSQNPLVNKIIKKNAGQEIHGLIKNHLNSNDLVIYIQHIIYNLLAVCSTPNFNNQTSLFDAFKTVLFIFNQFETKQSLIPYKKLLKDYAQIWNEKLRFGKNLLLNMMNKFKKFCESIQNIVSQPIDVQVKEDDMKMANETLYFLPELLVLMCKLFSHQFEIDSVMLKNKILKMQNKLNWQNQENQVPKIEEVMTLSEEDSDHKISLGNQESVIKNLKDDLLSFIDKSEKNLTEKGTITSIKNRFSYISQQNNQSDASQKIQLSHENGSFQLRFDTEATRQTIFIDDEQNKKTFISANSETFYQTPNFEQQEDVNQQLMDCLQDMNILEESRRIFSQDIKNGIISLSRYLHQKMDTRPDDEKFYQKMEQIICFLQNEKELKSQNKSLSIEENQEIERLFDEVIVQYKKTLEKFPYVLKNRLFVYFEKRKFVLLSTFWDKLDKILLITQQYIDSEFLNNLFDEQHLLLPVENYIEQIVQKIIPNFEEVTSNTDSFNLRCKQFYDKHEKNPQILYKLKNDLSNYQTEIIKLRSDLIDVQAEINSQLITKKVVMLSKILSNDVLFFKMKEEDIQNTQQIALKISQSVFILIRQFKPKNIISVQNKFEDTTQNKIKDTTQSELLYYFLYKMQEFEKRFQKTCVSPLRRKHSILEQKESNKTSNSIENKVVSVDDEEEGKLSSSKDHATVNLSNSTKPKQSIKNELQSMKMRSSKLINRFLQNNSEKRLCLFLNELEEVLAKCQDLQKNSEQLKVQDLAKLKIQFNSLFRVIAIQLLSNLSSNVLIILYNNRPGCLDRLLKQIYGVTKYDFGPNEFFFQVKRLQVINQFSKDVIEMICNEEKKSKIEQIQEKYTYKSILSQLWNLQFTLYTEDAKILYEYQTNVPSQNTEQFKQDCTLFKQRLEEHMFAHEKLWNNFKSNGSLLLSEEHSEQTSEIKIIKENLKTIIQILTSDLQNLAITEINSEKLVILLRPLAQFLVQIDIITYKTKGILSQFVFEQIEQLIGTVFKTPIGFQKKDTQQTQESHNIFKSKKRQIYQVFEYHYSEYVLWSKENEENEVFRHLIEVRINEIIEIIRLYNHVMEYERLVTNQKVEIQHGNLIAQLITFSDLMIKLQDKHLNYQFKLLIDHKYNTMIEQIQNQIYNAYKKEKDKYEQDGELEFFQKHQYEDNYRDYMKEVRAFMMVENYRTFKSALDIGYIKSQSKANIILFQDTINRAVEALVPPNQNCQENYRIQYFDVAIELLQDLSLRYNKTYKFDEAMETLNKQRDLYERYEKEFDKKKKNYCTYYRINIEDYLPKEIMKENRIFVLRTSSNYNVEYVKDDLSALIERKILDPQKSIKKIHQLTNEIRNKYEISPNTYGLSNTDEEVFENCPKRYKHYYEQNFKNQFYYETPQNNMDEDKIFQQEHGIVILETKKQFPTLTNIQVVERIYEKRIPAVKYDLYEVNLIITEIQNVIKHHNQSSEQDSNQQSSEQDSNQQQSEQDQNQQSSEQDQNQPKTQHDQMEKLINKYLINDQVGGGLEKVIKKYFNLNQKEQFQQLDNPELKRAYLKLYQACDSLFVELRKLLDVFQPSDSGKVTALGEERLSYYKKLLLECKKAYKIQQLQDQF